MSNDLKFSPKENNSSKCVLRVCVCKIEKKDEWNLGRLIIPSAGLSVIPAHLVQVNSE